MKHLTARSCRFPVAFCFEKKNARITVGRDGRSSLRGGEFGFGNNPGTVLLGFYSTSGSPGWNIEPYFRRCVFTCTGQTRKVPIATAVVTKKLRMHHASVFFLSFYVIEENTCLQETGQIASMQKLRFMV
jgi:hypothetical protein